MPSPLRPHALLCALALALALGGVAAQDSRGPSGTAPRPDPLEALADSIALVKDRVAEKRALVEASSSDAERTKRAAELSAEEERLEGLQGDFEAIGTGVDIEAFREGEQSAFDLGKEFEELLQPLVEELKNATARPREIERLRNEIDLNQRRRSVVGIAIANLDASIAAATDPAVSTELERLRVRWSERSRTLDNRLQVLEHKLEQSLQTEDSIIDTVTDSVKSFFRTRGKNLFAALFAFLAVYFGMRWLGRYLHRFSPWHRPGRRSFYARLVDVIYSASTFVGAVFAAMAVLYAAGDWVLLGLSILFLLGLVLAAKGGLPKFYEHARLLLNLGEVREGERVLIEGVPWRVKSLGVFTDLENPLLDGGHLRLPMRTLSSLRSRPFDEKEPWFPCREGEWVILSDKTRGKVIQQTPEMVHLVLLGGSRKHYLTADFLAATPEVLSRNFRVRSIFGIDYQHQDIATGEVAEILQAAVMVELLELVDRDQIQRVKVEFREAGASSLDYEIVADMKGEVADKYEVVARALQKAALDACNANGWVVPFTQITLHHAGGESPGEAV